MTQEVEHKVRVIPQLSDYGVTEDGLVFSLTSNWRGYGVRELKQQLNAHGYPSVRLTIGHLRRKRIATHKLVAKAFLPARPSDGHEIRHLDGNKTNNHVGNLAWGTRKDNATDREVHGHTSRGVNHSDAIKRGIYEKRI